MIRRALMVLAATLAPAGAGATDPVARVPEVMLVGSYHLANNNRDLINLKIDDVTTPARQAEIERLVDGLARWRPTRVAVEWRRSDQAALDRRYADYRAGTLKVTANERDQIGLRLAAKLGLARVDAIDWSGDAPGPGEAYDIMAWARNNGEQARFDAFVRDGQAEVDRTGAAMRGQTVGQWYRALNTPASRLKYHRAYFTIATFGTDADNPGAAWDGAWYARNLRIFNNLRDVAGAGDRVLVLYGSGHAYLLDAFMRESGAMRPVDPLGYLPRR